LFIAGLLIRSAREMSAADVIPFARVNKGDRNDIKTNLKTNLKTKRQEKLGVSKR
jgi:hypothetical protein